MIEPKNIIINKNKNEKQDLKIIKDYENEKNIKYNYIKKNIKSKKTVNNGYILLLFL